MMDGRVAGVCEEFCPSKEVSLRRRERLVHKLESEKVGLQLVKEYSRPAAGQAPPTPRDIRTPHTLQHCVSYLLTEVLQAGLEITSLQELYDFLFDRLRAVRQDLTLQSSTDPDISLEILARCVRFHLVFGLLLQSQPTFSRHINTQHQLDCLKSCLLLNTSSKVSTVSTMTTMHCAYLLSNMDSEHALAWAVNISQRSQLLDVCVRAGLSYRGGDYVLYFRLVSSLPLLLQVAASHHSHLMLQHSVRVCRVAYRSPNVKYPLSHLAELLWIQDQGLLADYLRKEGVKVENSLVMFGVKGEEVQGDEGDDNHCYNFYLSGQIRNQFSSGLDRLILGESTTM